MDVSRRAPRPGTRRSPALTAVAAILVAGLSPARAAAQAGTAATYELSLEVVSLPDGWNLGEVAALAIDAREHLYVFHRGPHPLLEFDADGRFVREIGAGLFADAHGLRVDPDGNLWAVDRGAHVVVRFDPDGRVTRVLGMRGRAGLGWFDRDYDVHFLDRPQDVGFDSRGNVYVADRGNEQIVKFDADGRFVRAWGEKGNRPGQFDFPHAVAVDDRDRVLVADRENRRVQVFDVDGRFLEEWAHVGYPYGLTIAPDGTPWLTDARHERILHLDRDGTVLGRYGGVHGKAAGQLGFVHGIAVTSSGAVLVGEVLNWRLQRLDLR